MLFILPGRHKKLQEQLEEWIEKLRQEGLWEQMNENAQIWNIVMETFDQLAEILGSKAGIDEFCRILESDLLFRPA